MRDALAAHLTMLGDLGEDIPVPRTDAEVAILSPAAA